MQDIFKSPWGSNTRCNYRENTNDWNTLTSCLVEDEYQIAKLATKGLVQNGVAVDLGAHIGGVSLALASRGFKVIAVEMFPENIDLLEKNILTNLMDPDIEVVGAAICGGDTKEEEVTAYYTDSATEFGKAHEFIGTIVDDKFIGDTDKHGRSIKVPLISLTDLLKDIDAVEFMKIDIEGAEWEVVKWSRPEVLKKIKRIAVEIESLDGKETSTTEFLKLLPKGFKDVSKEYFPKWCAPGMIVHGYFIQEDLDEK